MSSGGGGGGGGQYFYFKNIEDPHFSIFDRNINAFIHI